MSRITSLRFPASGALFAYLIAAPVGAGGPTQALTAGTVGDGRHDFDFNLGTWETHISRLGHPLSGSTTWTSMEGAVVIGKIWDGRGQIEEVEADGPGGHFEGTTLFLYHPERRHWSINLGKSKVGVLSQPAFGEFKEGRGEFTDQEFFQGPSILVRIVWSEITADAHRFEQFFSRDGGTSWDLNFVAQLKRTT